MNKLRKEEMGISDHLICLLRNRMQVKKQQLELDLEQQTGSKTGEEYIKAVYCHPAYLTYMQSTQWHPTPVSRVTIHSLDMHLSQFGTSLLFHVQF